MSEIACSEAEKSILCVYKVNNDACNVTQFGNFSARHVNDLFSCSCSRTFIVSKTQTFS